MLGFRECQEARRSAPHGRLAAIAVGAVVAAAHPAAAEATLADAGCNLRDGGSAIVSSVLDPVTLELNTGEVVRLAGIIAPDSRNTRDAVDVLAELALGRAVLLRHGEVTHDRYDRTIAHVTLAGEESIWLQQQLLADGHAMVAGFVGDRQCLAELLQFERAARSAGRGLWATRTVPDAWSDRLRTGTDRFEIAEGRVVSVGRTERTVYLNFGHDWSRDLTVTIFAKDASWFEAEYGPLEQLVDRRIRVRGWLSQWDGPWIRVDHPEQIELLDD